MASIRKRTWKPAGWKEGDKLREAWAVDYTDQNGDRQRKQFRTKGKADAFRIEVEGQIRAGTFRPDADKVTVKEGAEQYLDHVKGRSERGERFSRRHLAMVEGRVWNYICPDPARRQGVRKSTPFTEGVAGVKFAHLTPPVVDDFRDRLRSAGVSVPMTRKILGTLHAICEFAVRKNIVAVNAARGVRVIGKRGEGSKKVTPPSKEAVRQVIAAADQDFAVEIIFAAASGLRAGEQHALRWKHIDFDRSEVSVETRVDAYNEEDLPKSEAGLRTVPIGADVLHHLRKWKMRSKWSKADDLVFPNKSGNYVRHGHMLKDRFYPLFDKLAALHKSDPSRHPPAPKRFKWHALRHFAVSCWIEAGLQPKTVQTFVGHATLQMTMDTYGHMFPSDDHAKAMDAIAKGLFT
ncbi:site-specific recombinase XerC [Bradyrhizobium sp. R2.2-H]|jgi:integrase|uniref:tyrosine-type recombinase/integrase n=1 Tax=unclassified Bradyrhizobium TaxID=2631580 RepID=UPI00104E6B55|nr:MULTISPECIES: site-specific integrase [unclassified Bradyrhizobium]TCU68238.1 site-specific recombinase XerC [Bradyrhizobium sp. Y-H1]TCU70140.1 site-specific recombinase XerC [Bradyrhizobium sp. R2.2-H]